MGFFQDLIELVRDNSFNQVEDEAAKEVTIALAGNSTEVRDRLHKALSTRLESLWTSSPFRLIETFEKPVIEAAEVSGGLLIYALYSGDTIPAEKKTWLLNLVSAPGVSAIIVTLDRNNEGVLELEQKPSRNFNPLRLLNSPSRNPENEDENLPATAKPHWKTDLAKFVEQSPKLDTVLVPALHFSELQKELLPLIVRRLTGRELALARRAPIFRYTVSSHFIKRTARDNADLVLLANATGNLPFLSGIFGGGADFVLLSKNQFELSHRLATLYGQKRTNRVEVFLELTPIVGAALVWRNLARVATNRLPYFVAIVPKAAIAYGATLAVGKIADYYYANGRSAPAELAGAVRNVIGRLRSREADTGNENGDLPPRRLHSL